VSRIAVFLLWLIRFLPFGAVAAIGSGLGGLLFWLIPQRRHVARVNLQKCFPGLPPAERERLARAAFRAFFRSFVDRGILWWSSRERIRRFVRVEGLEHLEALKGRRVILLAPHFVGLDAAVTRLAMDHLLAGMYSNQSDPYFNKVMDERRNRFGGFSFPRQAGLLASLRPMRQGAYYYYLPDLDMGPKRAVFVPFFGVPAATVTGLTYIARFMRAAVVPCVTRMLPGAGGYVVTLHPAWTDYPTGDEAADARRMLAFIEERVREMPDQYHWLHKRFKTRPPGEAGFY
jgi:KDO2-lipid IV(A) lauroyltransferase